MIIKENINNEILTWKRYSVSLNVLDHQLKSLYF